MGKRRWSGGLVVGALALLVFVAVPGSALAVKTPGLASSTQYKAFIE